MTTYRLESNISCAIFTKDHIDAFIQKLMDNPFGDYQFIIDDTGAESVEIPFDAKVLKKQLSKRKTWDYTIHNNTQEGDFIETLLVQRKNGTTINFIVQNKSLNNEYETFYNYILEVIAVIPAVSSAFSYDANADLIGLYADLNLDFPPACFKSHLKWQHMFGPNFYSMFLKREDLLNMPSYKVEELDNGLINIVNYENPFNWNTKANKEKLVESTTYLNERDHFMKDF